MDIPNRIVAMVHDRVGEALKSFLSGGPSPFFINPSDTLLAQLEDPNVAVPRVSAGFIGDIAVSSVSGLVSRLRALSDSSPGDTGGGTTHGGPGELLSQVRTALRAQLPFLPSLGDANAPGGAIEELIGLLETEARDIRKAAQAFQDRVNTILQGLTRPGQPDDDASVKRVKQMLGNDIGTVMPLAAIANAIRGLPNAADVPHSIEKGLLSYFFSSDGYRTVDGDGVLAPVQLSQVESIAAGFVTVQPGPTIKVDPAPLKQIKGLFTTATAEQYLRDTIRIIVESAYDALRSFRDTDTQPGRFGAIVAKLKARKKTQADQQAVVTKFITWFRGFSSMAESGAMRAVEIGTQGVSEFQTNPLIAAAAGAFAGTVARKLAQESFLNVLSTELKAVGG